MRQIIYSGLLLIILTVLSIAPISAQDTPPSGGLQVVETNPLQGEEISLDSAVTIYFDRPVTCASAEQAFSINTDLSGTPICSVDATSLSFLPQGGFDIGVDYVIMLDGGLTAQDGTTLGVPFMLEFSTAGTLRVSQVLPAAQTADVATDAVVTVIFNRPVVPLGTVDDMENLPDPLLIFPDVPGEGEWLNTSIYTFTPEPAWAGGATYEIVIDAGLEAVDGTTLTQAYGWSFSTAPPRVDGIIPEDAAGDAPLDQTIQITFNQPMNRASVESAFVVSPMVDVTISGAFEWAEDSTGFRFTPDALLAIDTVYQVGFSQPPTALAGGAIAGEGAIRIASFATVPPPSIVGTTPPDGELNAPAFGGITLMFASPMNADTFEGRISIAPEPWLEPEFFYQDYNNALTVSFPTEPSTDYTITVEPGLEDAYGNVITTPFTFSYTTQAYDPNFSLQVPGAVGFYNAYREQTNLYVTHRNVSSLNLQLYAVPLDEFAQRLVDPNRFDPTFEYLPRQDTLLRNWQIDSVAPQNTLRYELLNLGDVAQGSAPSDCPGALPSRVQVGDTAIVITDPDPVRARSQPVDGEIVELLYRDYVLPVVGGPVCSPGITWWEVRLRDESTLWVAEGADGEYFIDLRAAAESSNVVIPTSQLGDYVDEDGGLVPGIYYLEVQSPENAQRQFNPQGHFMVVATANLLMKSTVDEVLIWATDVESGQPVPTAPITLYDQNYNQVVSGITDNDGLLRLDMLRVTDLNVPHIAILRSDAHFGVGLNRWSDGVDAWRFGYNPVFYPQQYRAYLYTDRPIYRPDQPVYFRGVVRTQDDTTYGVSDLQSVTATITNDRGEIVSTLDLPLTEFGTFSGEFDIAADASLGFYQIRVELPSQSQFQNEGAFVNFSVAEYRLPEFQVELDAQTPEVVQGDTISLTLDSTYFFGGVVANADVEYNVITQPYAFEYDGRERFSFIDLNPDGGPRDMFIGSQGVIASGEGTTDENGNLTIEIPATLDDFSASQRFTIEAVVTDESDQAVAGRTSVIVHQGQLYVGIVAQEYVAFANRETTLDLISVDWDSQPIAGQDIAITVVERRWSSVQERDPNTGRTVWTYEVEEIPVTDGSVTSDDDGRATFSFTPPRGGVYKISTLTRDDEGNEIRSATTMWVSSGEYVSWRQQNSNRIDLVSDADDYSVGDVAQILIPSPFQGQVEALVTVERGEVLLAERITLDSNSTVYELPISADFAPNVYVSVVLVNGVDESNPVAGFRMGLIQLNVDRAQLELNIEITSDPEAAGPQDTVTYTVRTTDYQGNPVSAEVGVGLTDLASLSIADPNSQPIADFYYGEQGLSVRTSTPLTINTDQLTQNVLDTIKGGGGGFGEGGIFDIREEFVDTAYWNGALVTDANGEATFEVTLPDNLTTWRLDARALTLGAEGRMLVGQDTFDLLSTRPLLIRPVTPRFFVVGDEVSLGAIVNNNTGDVQTVNVSLQGSGYSVEGDTLQEVIVPAGGQVRVDWRVTVEDVEFVDLTFGAVTPEGDFGDASKPPLGQGDDQLLPVYRYEAPEVTGTGGILNTAGSRTESIVLPRRFDVTQGDVTINIEPSLAASSVAALDTLYGFPGESIEHVVSRFLPNIMSFRAFNRLGISTQRDLRAELNREVQFAIQRLYAQQKVDGGWGWYVEDDSNPLVTAYALIGLVEASETGFAVDPAVIQRAIGFIDTQYTQIGLNVEDWRLNRQAFLLYAVARAGQPNVARTTNLFDERSRLSLYARALLAQTLHIIDPAETSRTDTLLAGFMSNAILSANGVHWQEDSRDVFNWNTDTRTTAMILQTLVRLTPESDLIPNVVRWLMVARSADAWQTIQETAWALMALTDFMVASGDFAPDYDFSVNFNGDALVEGSTSPDNASVMRRLVVDVAQLLQDAPNTLVLERGEGSGVLYYTAYLRAFLPVPEIDALNRGIIVERRYVPLDNTDGASITQAQVGELVQVRLTIIAPNDLHYVTIEDPIPAGSEAVNPSLLTSQQIGTRPELNPDDPLIQGWGWWWFSRINFEDERVVLNSTFLPAGTYEYVYTIRTGLPGVYNVLPATAREVYFPEVFGRSDGTTFTITPEE